MWDDRVRGEVVIPEIHSVRGFETLQMNTMVGYGINFMRMCTEPAHTSTCAAFQTGHHAVASGVHTVFFLVECSTTDVEEINFAKGLRERSMPTPFSVSGILVTRNSASQIHRNLLNLIRK